MSSKTENRVTSARRYSMRPRGIIQTLDRIDASHLKAPSAFEHRSFTVRVVILDHDQPGIVNTDWRAFDHDAVGWRI